MVDRKVLAFILTRMDAPGVWIRTERMRMGLSTRDLARLAGVSYPTVSRIENGHEQPRWSTIEKICAVLGRSLTPIADDGEQLRLADLSNAWTKDATGDHHPEWVRLRGLVDHLRRRPLLVAQAILPEPPPSRSELMNVLLAAVAEKLADDHGIARPRWTRKRPPLRQPWSLATRASKRDADEVNIPEQFRKRGLLIPVSTIWRDREVIPV
ncbi:MAG: XRE family transcriptional regulator [Acidimicrobiia bacterium]|jgi:transcriptional regulator with XRE-family HTH domain|nr:XRE family transcriptional regulator [Acidimicrobiia bacterium]